MSSIYDQKIGCFAGLLAAAASFPFWIWLQNVLAHHLSPRRIFIDAVLWALAFGLFTFIQTLHLVSSRRRRAFYANERRRNEMDGKPNSER